MIMPKKELKIEAAYRKSNCNSRLARPIRKRSTGDNCEFNFKTQCGV
jgi:hypothetical protein